MQHTKPDPIRPQSPPHKLPGSMEAFETFNLDKEASQ